MMNFTFFFSFISFAIAIPRPARPIQTGISQAASEFEVKSLPDGPQLPKSWAGRFPVPETKEGNSLFFWLFEAEDSVYDDNLIIWFNGGPGCSSLIGLSTGNGPLSFVGNSTTLTSNPFSWTKLAHVLYVDQPVGTGFSTASNPNPATTNDRVTSDFYAWLNVLYERFPHLLSKKTHMMGESWAGIYVPYFADKILENYDSLPINLQSISLGDGTFGSEAAIVGVAASSYIRSKNATLHIPDDILDTFAEADQICGFDSVLEEGAIYPPKGQIRITGNSDNDIPKSKRQDAKLSISDILSDECDIKPTTKEEVKESIMSTCYGPCATFSTAEDYLATRSKADPDLCFDMYNIKNDCNTVNPQPLLAKYFSRPDVQAALNIPTASNNDSDNGSSKTFVPCNTKIQSMLADPTKIPTPPSYQILPDLITNKNISTHIYQGENDMLINHLGIELVLQNMTWNGMQGFQKKPETPFGGSNSTPGASGRYCGQSSKVPSDDAAGIWTEERGLTYHLFKDAGHSVPSDQPAEMWDYVRDVVVGRP